MFRDRARASLAIAEIHSDAYKEPGEGKPRHYIMVMRDDACERPGEGKPRPYISGMTGISCSLWWRGLLLHVYSATPSIMAIAISRPKRTPRPFTSPAGL